MPSAILQRAEDLTPDLATDFLRRSGALPSGRVTRVDLIPEAPAQRGIVANVARVRLTYNVDASGSPPASLFLKMSKPHPAPTQLDQREVAYYRATGSSRDLPLPRIHDAAVGASGETHIVMDDLTASHAVRHPPVPPTIPQCEAIIEAIGRVHAVWWNSPRIDTDLATPVPLPADAQRSQYVADCNALAQSLGDALLPAQRTLYEGILASDYFERTAERVRSRHNVTVAHGDLHAGNIMLPAQPDGQVVLIDWHEWFVGSPTFDIAFFIAPRWTRERRVLLEEKMVRLYHATLLRNGVTGYTFEQCRDDYRRDILACLVRLLEYHRRRMPMGLLWHSLQNATAAAQDLACLDVL